MYSVAADTNSMWFDSQPGCAAGNRHYRSNISITDFANTDRSDLSLWGVVIRQCAEPFLDHYHLCKAYQEHCRSTWEHCRSTWEHCRSTWRNCNCCCSFPERLPATRSTSCE